DIYLKQIGRPNHLRLTNDPADDCGPALSPDGRSIGFIRLSKERSVFVIIPSIGGPERIVAEVACSADSWRWRPFAWFPDGKWVVTDGLRLLSVETGEARQLISPPAKFTNDFSPSVSPDGHTVAFSRSTGGGIVSDIYLLDLDEELRPKREP